MRKLNAYEKNLCLKFGIDPFEAEKEISENQPIEYFLNKAIFRENTFYVDENVLIPRPETEELIDFALKDFEKFEHIDFFDVGTGSGCIGISFAIELSLRNISFDGYLSDVSENAVEITKKNLKNLIESNSQNCFTFKAQSGKLKIIQSDLLFDYPKNKKSDIIFANLPYIPNNRKQELSQSVKDFEPHLALFGGENGLDLINKLLEQAKTYLKPTGKIYLEVDDTHLDLSLLDNKIQNHYSIKILNDENEKTRYWICTPNVTNN